ncbi:MAG: HlyC/CorC family transporter [Firmicutes bacterium]|nr:HlyC/CorC family transporter [Bacillota bacterium]
MDTTMIIVIILMILLSGFFSATETAFTGANYIRLKSMAQDGNKRASRVLDLLERYDRLISTLLIGNNVVNIIASTLATLLFTRWFTHNGPVWSTICITLLVLFFGEITPKTIAKQIPEKFACAVVGLVRPIVVCLTPLTYLVSHWQKTLAKAFGNEEEQAVTEDELMTMIDEVEEDGILDEQESDLIRSAIEFHDVTAEEILTHRVNVVGVEKNMTMEEVGQVFSEHSFSRLPVYEETIDEIIGVLHERDYMHCLLHNETNWTDKIQPAAYFPENIKIQNLLEELRQKQTHMAVIVDEYGGTQGIVTMEDILEELVGEIWDEHDKVVVDHRQVDDKTFVISGAMDLDEFFELLDEEVDEDAYESTTVSGWVSEMLEKMPAAGDTFEFRNLTLLVQVVADRKVERLLVVRKEAAEEKEDA